MTSVKLIRLLRQHNILTFGTFRLRGGVDSSYYCDVKEAFGTPEILDEIAKHIAVLVPQCTTCIACSGYDGITIASIVAYKKKLPLVLVRDKSKDHGTKKITEGCTHTKSDYVCIIDDVFTTGSSIRDTKERLRPFRCKFVTPVVVLNRSKSNKVVSILRDTDLFNNRQN